VSTSGVKTVVLTTQEAEAIAAEFPKTLGIALTKAVALADYGKPQYVVIEVKK
jgi:hypothetical protein